MVGAVCRRAFDAVAGDVRAFTRQMRATYGRGTRPGLHAHRIRSNGGERRLHLRIHDDRSGALFVDVSHVVHLTPTAAEMARMLLDGAPEARVGRVMRAWYPDAPEDQLQRQVRDIAVAIEALK
ncbi:MAG TPA: hypothetical protein QGH10_03825, partial [Armatimonadota bacterium]|nr:hypothetical protein [Armatimonadota bacterium]